MARRPKISTPQPPAAHKRLLDAAARVFARDGIEGATTREIAREARVNEVTLFRHFKSKDRLLAAVVSDACNTRLVLQGSLPPMSADLRADLLSLARFYHQLLTVNLPLVRAMIGEMQRHQQHERQVFRAIFLPLKEALSARFEKARAEGSLKPSIDVGILTDLFTSMIFTGVIRENALCLQLPYSPDNYLIAAVELLLNGAGSAQQR